MDKRQRWKKQRPNDQYDVTRHDHQDRKDNEQRKVDRRHLLVALVPFRVRPDHGEPRLWPEKKDEAKDDRQQQRIEGESYSGQSHGLEIDGSEDLSVSKDNQRPGQVRDWSHIRALRTAQILQA